MEQVREELTEVTNELLNQTNIIKENIKKSMVVGEVNILKGVIIFEVILKEVNPVVINDEEVNRIINIINMYLNTKEEKEQKVNNYVHHGINKCIIMLDMYNKNIKRKVNKMEK